MKTFAAALLFAGAAAAGTTYSAAGGTTHNATGIASSKFTALVTLTGTSLTTKSTIQVVASAALAADKHDIAGMLCTLREASKSVCTICDVAYQTADATKYNANHTAATYAATAPTLAAATTALKSATNLTAAATKAQTAIAWGTTVASPAVTASQGWALNSIMASTDKKTMDCAGTYTDPTSGTAARETATKGGMATAYAGTSSGLATRASKLATIKLVTGALSNIATVGAAVAALAMSF